MYIGRIVNLKACEILPFHLKLKARCFSQLQPVPFVNLASTNLESCGQGVHAPSVARTLPRTRSREGEIE